MKFPQIAQLKAKLNTIKNNPGKFYASKVNIKTPVAKFNPKSVIPTVEAALIHLEEAEKDLDKIPEFGAY